MNTIEAIMEAFVKYVDSHSNETRDYGWTINSLAVKSKLKVILTEQLGESDFIERTDKLIQATDNMIELLKLQEPAPPEEGK